MPGYDFDIENAPPWFEHQVPTLAPYPEYDEYDARQYRYKSRWRKKVGDTILHAVVGCFAVACLATIVSSVVVFLILRSR